eukprot:TRINITY_DN3850_c0_g1_i3.p1 TRINITY_DN3850_c0_g1~~TRINITY_DN3850_c0_g1_i3.p1  ORF type:complete len:230 (+),score=58.35 TRINITY_DN3850_c0_g1_i3:86-691(+)
MAEEQPLDVVVAAVLSPSPKIRPGTACSTSMALSPVVLGGAQLQSPPLLLSPGVPTGSPSRTTRHKSMPSSFFDPNASVVLLHDPPPFELPQAQAANCSQSPLCVTGYRGQSRLFDTQMELVELRNQQQQQDDCMLHERTHTSCKSMSTSPPQYRQTITSIKLPSTKLRIPSIQHKKRSASTPGSFALRDELNPVSVSPFS